MKRNYSFIELLEKYIACEGASKYCQACPLAHTFIDGETDLCEKLWSFEEKLKENA